MRTSSCLIGLTLCIAGIGSASGTSLSTQNLDGGDRTSADRGSSHMSEGGSDALGLGHDSAAHDSGEEQRSGTSTSSGQPPSGSGSPATAVPARQSHMSWQSLLPGSIQ